MQKTIADCAVVALTHIAETNGGKIPTTLGEIHALPSAYGIGMEAWRGGYKLVVAPDGPVIFYNPSDLPHAQKRGIVHEIVEWLTIGDQVNLFDDLVGMTIHRDGGMCPSDFRHRVAQFAETVYSAWLIRHG